MGLVDIPTQEVRGSTFWGIGAPTGGLNLPKSENTSHILESSHFGDLSLDGLTWIKAGDIGDFARRVTALDDRPPP